jgi:LysM repeat protein
MRKYVLFTIALVLLLSCKPATLTNSSSALPTTVISTLLETTATPSDKQGVAPIEQTVVNPTPAPTQPSDRRTEVITYTVQAGENIFSIAARFHLRAETILWANEETLADDPHRIQPGVILNILPVDGVYYQWQAGDDLAKVAEHFGVKPEDILNWPGNRLDVKNPTPQPGGWLIIPGGTHPVSAN